MENKHQKVLKKWRNILRSAITKICSKIENSMKLDEVSEELEQYVKAITDKLKSLKIADNEPESS